MELRVKAEDAAAEQTLQQFIAPRADRERFRIGPWNVPKRNNCRRRQAFADHLWQQSEMVILDEHDRIGRLRFGRDGRGKLRVDLPVIVPIAASKRRPHVRDVAERP